MDKKKSTKSSPHLRRAYFVLEDSGAFRFFGNRRAITFAYKDVSPFTLDRHNWETPYVGKGITIYAGYSETKTE